MTALKQFIFRGVWIWFWVTVAASDGVAAGSLRVETSTTLIQAGRGFPVSVSSWTDGMPDLTSGQEVELQGVVQRARPQVVISQFQASRSSSLRSVELINVSGNVFQFRGVVRVYTVPTPDSEPKYSETAFHGPGAQEPILLMPGERLLLGASRPPGFPGQVRSLEQAASLPTFDAVLLLQDDVALDAWVGTNYLAHGGKIPSEANGLPVWSGVGAPGDSKLAHFRRVGHLRHASAVDWVNAVAPPATPYQFELPLVSAPYFIPVTPSRVRMEAGRWQGLVVLSAPANDLTLHVDNLRGITAESPAITVLGGDSLRLEWPDGNVLREGGDPVTARVSLPQPVEQEVSVSLSSSNPEEVMVPAEVRIAPRALSAAFQVSPILDGLVDGPRLVQLSASAFGFQSSLPLILTNYDSSENALRLTISDPVEVDASGQGRISLEIQLDRAMERASEVRLSVQCLSHPGVTNISSWLVIPSVALAPGTQRFQFSTGFRNFPLAFAAQFRVVASIPGWREAWADVWFRPHSVGPTFKWVTDIPLNSLSFASLSWIAPGVAWVSNALRLELSQSLDHDYTVRLESKQPEIVAVPEVVTFRALQQSVRVPIQLDLRGSATEPRLVKLLASTFDGSRAELDSFVSDDDFSSFEVVPAGASLQPFVSGVTRSVYLKLNSWLGASDPRRVPSQSLFSGELQLSFDFKGQPIVYEGPSRVTFGNGSATIPMRFTGTTRAFEFILTDPNGQAIHSEPLELVAGPSEPLPPVDLGIAQLAPPDLEADGGVTVSLVVTNLGSVQARRVTVVFRTTTGNVVSQGKGKAIYPVGDLAPFQDTTIQVHLERMGQFGTYYGAYFVVEADNSDPDAANNQVVMEFPPKLPAPIPAKEITLPGSDLAFSLETGFFYGSRSNAAPSIVEIDPRTAEVVREFPVVGNPGLLQATTVGRQLYALVDNGSRLLRVDLRTGETNLSIALPQPGQDLATVPGTSNRVVVAGVDSVARVFVDGDLISASSQKVSWLEPDMDGRGVVGIGDRVLVSEDGSRWQEPPITPSSAALSGTPLRPDAGWRGWRDQLLSVSMKGQDTLPGYSLAYAPSGLSGDLVVDPASGSLYYGITASDEGVILVAFNPRNPFSKKLQRLPGLRSISRLTRFGARGLAFRTYPGRMVFVESPIVESGELTDVQVQLGLQLANSEPGRYRMQLQITNAGPSTASNAVLLLRPALGDKLLDSEGHQLTLNSGDHVLSLGDLRSGETVQLQYVGWMPNSEMSVHVVRAEVFGNWVESDPMNNVSLRPRVRSLDHPFSTTPSAAPMLSLSRQEIFLPVRLDFLEMMDDGFALVVLDGITGSPKRILPMGESVSIGTFSSDESVIYLVSGENKSLRQVDPESGLTKAWSVRPGAPVVKDLLSPMGLRDIVISFERTANVGNQLAVYRDLAPVSVRRVNYGAVVQGEGSGDIFGGLSGSVGPLSRLRLQGDQLTLLGVPSSVSGFGRSLAHPPGWIVVDSGEVYSAVDGSYAGKLWDRAVPQSVSAHPILPLVLTAQNDSPNDRQTHLQLWDVAERRLVCERHVPIAAGQLLLLVALAEQKMLLQGVDGLLQVLHCPSAHVPEVAVRMTASTDRPSVGELFSVTFDVTNRSLTSLENASLAIDFGPLMAEIVDGPDGGGWSRDADGLTHLDLGSVPRESEKSYIVRLRSYQPAFVPIEVSLRSATFHRRSDESPGPVIWVGADLSPELVTEFRLGSNSRFSVWEGVAGRDEVWLGYRGWQNRVFKLDLTGSAPRVAQMIPIPFSPEFLAMDASGASLYVAPTFGPVHRLQVGPEGLVRSSRLSGSRGEGYGVTAMAAAPGQSGHLAIGERSAAGSRLILFADERLLLQQYSLETNIASRLVFGSDDQLIAAIAKPGWVSLLELAVNQSGLSLKRSIASTAPLAAFIHSDGRLFFQNGTTIDVASGLIREAYPASVLVLPDAARGSTYVLPAFNSFTSFLPRLLTADLPGQGVSAWGLYSQAFGVPANSYRGWVGSNRVAILSDWGASQSFVVASLESLPLPRSKLGIQAEWTPTIVPAGLASTLTIAVTNYGPWRSSNVVLRLPDEYDSLFSHWVANEEGGEIRREGSELRMSAIKPSKELVLQFFFRGVSAPTELVPKFQLVSATPLLINAPLSAEARLRVVESNGITVSPFTVLETEGPAIVRVTAHLTNPALTPVRCRIETISGEAKSPSDFTPLVALLAWEPGASDAFADLRINGDRVPEPTETFRLRLGDAVGAAILSPEVSVTIIDNDGPGVQLSSFDFTEGNDGVNPVRLPIRLEAASATPVRFYYQTVSDTAASGLDFSPVHGVLEFDPGQVENGVGFAVVGDRDAERDERLLLELQPADGRSNTGGAASILIRNDDLEPELRLTLSLQDGLLRIGCQSVQGVEYQLQRARLLGAPWESTGSAVLGTGERIVFADLDGLERDTAFYRVTIIP